MRALVTGGTKGIGLAIVKALLENDYYVILTYSSDEVSAKNAEDDLNNEFEGRFRIVKSHMEAEADIDRFMQLCSDENLLDGGIDALVLNAGTTDRTRWESMTWKQWQHVMDVNINAPANLVRSLSPSLNENGNIIFISSDMSIYPHATSVPYTVSKSAINGLTIALVKEYAQRQIRVNAIVPGFVDTPWQKEKPEDQKKRICDKVALGRFADPAEIAEVAISIIRSTYINGALIKADGGYCYR